MTAKDAAAGLGGTAAELAGVANKVYLAQSGAINDLAAKFTQAATGSSDAVGKVDGAVKQLDGAWQGTSADSFVAYMANFTKAGQSLNEALTGAAADLRAAATGVQAARDALEGVFGELYDNATAWINSNPDATDEEKRGHIDSLASGYRGRVTTQIDNAEHAMAAAASALKGRTPNPRFSSIPEPDGQAFAPAASKKVEWASKSASPEGSSHGGGGSIGGLGSSGGPPSSPPPGNVQEWIRQAIELLRAQGINVTEADAQLIWEIIQHESGGNPNAINNWDSNAAKGTPSKGLMQTIDPTFNSYALPGHKDIWNPVDNICAGVNYAVSRYGSLSNVPGIKATHTGGGYVGY
ncbi:WXG100 family type VII secretion target [Actinokineospora baliensis]|uniref:transglycosylase SLT domain-containing protein n=1 Tax=Actinokineospora baliensis TaxID=547056 RepID=UPI0027DBF64C|nr:transglycosylase SLT domain-containing protein [Actinokineospora baliensis]MBM7770792.1 WXG100 family type VII secretion target [Actinokineospora baliensis]